jgi:CRP-like cAMP-binding protein
MDVHIRKLRARFELSTEEERFIRDSVTEIRDHAADETFVRAGDELSQSRVLLSGFVGRHKDLPSGTRQITELSLPGDWTDLHGFTLKRLDHNVAALSPCRVALVPHSRLELMMREHPRLTRIYWFGTNLDAAIHREWELCLGRRPGISRMAHLFCETFVRLDLVGLVQDDGYDLPLNQTELGECLGLTAVHVNRTLQQLRESGAIDFRGGRVMIRDMKALTSIAEFDPTYLYLGRQSF